MRIRAWSVRAYDGEVAGEIQLLNWRASEGINGGNLSGDVSLDLTTRDGRNVDYGACRRLVGRHGLLQVGFRSIALTGEWLNPNGSVRERALLGEWVLSNVKPGTSSTTVKVEGFQWAEYPRFMLITDKLVFSSRDAGSVLTQLLRMAYPSIRISIPAWTAGHSIGMDRESVSGQVADALQEVCEQDPTVEWTIDTTPVWTGDALKQVRRTARYGKPELRRTNNTVFEAPEPGGRQGNCEIEGGGENFRDYAHTIFMLGSGEGSRQLVAKASDSRLGQVGYIPSTRALSRPDVNRQATLDAQARAELRRSQGTRDGQPSLPADPFTITTAVDMLPTLPRLGDRPRLLHRGSWGFPPTPGGGPAIDQQIRVGEVEYSAHDSIMETIKIKAV